MMFTLPSVRLMATLMRAPSTLAIALALPGLATLGLIRNWRRGSNAWMRLPHPFDAPLPLLRDAVSLFESELARARRYERPCSVLVLRASQGVQHVSLAHVGMILRRSVRENDLACFDAAGERFVIALPECERAAAQAAGDRLRDILRVRTGADFVVGSATFPYEALILDDLIEAAAASRRRPLTATVSGLQPLVERARLRTHTQRQEP
jgi:hypothetical protein